MTVTRVELPPFLLDPDAGDCGIYALQALLVALGRHLDYDTLKAVSGDAFKLVFDTAPVLEPLRDLTPNDFIRDALAALGIRGAWHTGLSLDDLDRLLPAQLAAGFPVLTSHLLDTTGYQLIVGYEPGDVPRVAVRAGLTHDDLQLAAQRPLRWTPLDADWHGPVSSRARWDINPVFIIDDAIPPDHPDANPPLPTLLRIATRTALRIAEVFEIPYGTSGLEHDLSEEPLAGRTAAHGAEAWAMLTDYVRQRPPLDRSPFIWQLDTLTRRLAHDRDALARFFDRCAEETSTPDTTRATLRTLAQTARDIACGARDLRQLVWLDDAAHATSAEDVQRLLTSTRALAYPLPAGDDELIEELARRGYDDRIAHLTQATAVLMQDDVRWIEVLRTVRRLADLEAEIDAAMPRLADDTAATPEHA